MLQTLPAGTSLEPLFAALERDGAVIVERLIDAVHCRRIAGEFRPWLDREGLDSAGEFNGFKTLRISQVIARSPAALPLLEHPLVLATADRFLLKNCLNYQFGSLTGIEILPGEGNQRLHRDQNCYWKRFEGLEMQVSALWALDDFTLENGATRVVPGSHRWPLDRLPTADDLVVQATMPVGSLLLYLGSTFHGGGANRSNAARLALINTYALGWLRQEENMYLSIPREAADALPESIRLLMGYRRHGLVGWYPGAPEN
ncbi:MAG TPA: phytanoyl-CoA dioxygenase family protein [Kiloniellales bacterium]|nr:phytanoyl-CoA dioxygenase family protein [Kiloniellales bacterium]